VPLLLAAARHTGLCYVTYSREVASFRQDEGSVAVSVKGSEGLVEHRCKYLVACAAARRLSVACFSLCCRNA
jgi:2-polyprenyl-6-methoxyphenol hydroxylase-like FAD-dependent oxidoreductase